MNTNLHIIYIYITSDPYSSKPHILLFFISFTITEKIQKYNHRNFVPPRCKKYLSFLIYDNITFLPLDALKSQSGHK